MYNIKEAFGNNLRKIRKSKKITVENFSEILDITPRQLTKIESGETFLTSETLCKISLALDTSLASLFEFEWYDGQMYFDDKKYIKPHFKAVKVDSTIKIKSVPGLVKDPISQKISENQFEPFLVDFSKNNNMTIYVDYFVNKEREKVIKVTPEGEFSCLANKKILKRATPKEIGTDYYYIIEKLKDYSNQKVKMEYVRTAIDALSNKKDLEKLKTIIKGLELSL